MGAMPLDFEDEFEARLWDFGADLRFNFGLIVFLMTPTTLPLSSYFKVVMVDCAWAAPAMSAMINPLNITGTCCTLTGFLPNEGEPFRFA